MNKQKKNGFSLIEVVVYISLLAVVLVVLFAFFQQTILIKVKINDKAEVLDNAKFSLNKITWYLHNAKSINSPQFGSTADTLSMNSIDADENPMVFFVENNTLKIQKNSNPAIDLTNDRVKVEAISFINNALAENQNIIYIEIEVSSSSDFANNQPIKLHTSVKVN